MTRLTARPTSLLAAAALSASLCAQTGPQVVAFTGTAPAVVTQDTGSCGQTQCTPAGMSAPPASSPWVGGTAYDATSRGVWVSNGMTIGKYDTRNGCVPQCPVLPMPNTSPNNPVTGLSYYDPASTLYVTDQSGTIRWYTVGGGCQLSLAGRCIAPIPTGDILSGCATDDATGAIFYCAVTPGNPGGTVYVAQIGAPCLPYCQFDVLTCGTAPLGELTGLGYDPCAQVLWITDGRFTKGLSYDPISCALLGETQCCLNTIDRYIGLTVLSSSESSVGTSCTSGACPTCPSMTHFLASDPYIGNPTFSLDLADAPGGSTAFAVFNFGPSVPPAFSPPFCTGIRVPLAPPPLSGSAPTGGTPGLCNGSASVTVPIPPLSSLCGVPMCSQFLGVCPSSGLFVSNTLDWVIGGT